MTSLLLHPESLALIAREVLVAGQLLHRMSLDV